MASDVFTLVTVLLTVALSRAAEDLGSEIPPGIKLIKKSYTIIAQKNSPLYVNCSVSSKVGIRSFFWKKNGNPIVSRSRIKIQSNRSLYFREVVHRRKKGKKRNDEGIYECFVENEYGTVLATRVRLQVAGIQTTFLKEPEPHVAYVGGVASFQCDIKAVPPAVYVWEKDKVQLPQNVVRYASLPSGTLQISDVTKSDAGLYRCRSYHGALQLLPDQVDEFQWRISSEAQLTVREATNARPPKFIRKPSNVTAIAGTTVTLICIVDGKPMPKIQWRRKDGTKIRIDNVEVIEGGNLRLANVHPSDNGTYICSAVSPDGQTISASATLNVHMEPEIFSTFEHRSYPRAYVVDFECKYTGSPFPTVYWLFNGKKVEKSSRISILSKEKGISVLRIVQSQESDSGYYQCFAENEVGYATAVARFKVDVNDKAPNPPQNITVQGSGLKDLKITWSPPIAKSCCSITTYSVHCSEKSGTEMAKLVKVTSLVLKHLKPFTNYTCYVTAYSDYGASKHSNKASYVTPDATPLIAPKVEVVSSTQTSIKIKWEKIPLEQSRGIINQYRVYYNTDKGTTMERFKKPALREYLITELIPDTVYRIRMLAGTIAGFPHLDESSWPWTVTKTQSLTKPIETPKNLNVAIQNTSSVVVSWDFDKTVSIDYFVLQLYKVDAPEKKLEFRLPSNLTNYTLNNLDNNTFYQVSVNAFSGDDASIQVTKVFQTSSEATVPPAPSIISAVPVSSSIVNLTWERPDFSSDIVSYTVQYNPTTSRPGEKEKYIRTDLTSVSIKNLKPYTEYQFSVRSHSEDEKGPYGKLVIVRTNEGDQCWDRFTDSDNTSDILCHLCRSFIQVYYEKRSEHTCDYYCSWIQDYCADISKKIPTFGIKCYLEKAFKELKLPK